MISRARPIWYGLSDIKVVEEREDFYTIINYDYSIRLLSVYGRLNTFGTIYPRKKIVMWNFNL